MLHKSTFSTPFEPLLIPILIPLLRADREKKCQRLKQESRQQLRNAENYLFKNLKKPYVFSCFCIRKHPKAASKDPKSLPRHTQRRQKSLKKLYINDLKN